MAFSLLAGAVRVGTAADKPSAPDAPTDIGQSYFDTDSGIQWIGKGGGSWRGVGAYLSGIQPTPTAKTADATLTVAELLTRIVTATKASAVALTLPTGTAMDAGLSLPINGSIEWSVINLGSSSGAVTMTASTGHTIVGNAVVAISTSVRFRTVRTAANTYVTYRIGG